MYLIEKYMCLVLLYYTFGADGYRFDYKYFPEVNGSIKLHRVPVSWQEARLRCHYEGAVLASPSNSKLLEVMKNVIADNRVQSCGVFTGIHSLIYKGLYFSIEGVPLSRIPVTWAPNEPDNFENGENCLILLANGTMADVNCTETFPYMCFKKNEDLLMSNCGTLDPDYSLEKKTGSCYKFHPAANTWPMAYMICAAEGGHLAVINSETEFQVLLHLFKKEKVTGTVYKDNVLVGFYDWEKNGNWFTIHGETLTQAGFANWAENRPDNMILDGIGQSCGSILKHSTEGLDDLWCHTKLAFICEKSPTSLVSKVSNNLISSLKFGSTMQSGSIL